MLILKPFDLLLSALLSQYIPDLVEFHPSSFLLVFIDYFQSSAIEIDWHFIIVFMQFGQKGHRAHYFIHTVELDQVFIARIINIIMIMGKDQGIYLGEMGFIEMVFMQ